jgi:flagellar biosynthesis protein FliQ
MILKLSIGTWFQINNLIMKTHVIFFEKNTSIFNSGLLFSPKILICGLIIMIEN